MITKKEILEWFKDKYIYLPSHLYHLPGSREVFLDRGYFYILSYEPIKGIQVLRAREDLFYRTFKAYAQYCDDFQLDFETVKTYLSVTSGIEK